MHIALRTFNICLRCGPINKREMYSNFLDISHNKGGMWTIHNFIVFTVTVRACSKLPVDNNYLKNKNLYTSALHKYYTNCLDNFYLNHDSFIPDNLHFSVVSQIYLHIYRICIEYMQFMAYAQQIFIFSHKHLYFYNIYKYTQDTTMTKFRTYFIIYMMRFLLVGEVINR